MIVVSVESKSEIPIAPRGCEHGVPTKELGKTITARYCEAMAVAVFKHYTGGYITTIAMCEPHLLEASASAIADEVSKG